jgi:hypothetical protein
VQQIYLYSCELPIHTRAHTQNFSKHKNKGIITICREANNDILHAAVLLLSAEDFLPKNNKNEEKPNSYFYMTKDYLGII